MYSQFIGTFGQCYWRSVKSTKPFSGKVITFLAMCICRKAYVYFAALAACTSATTLCVSQCVLYVFFCQQIFSTALDKLIIKWDFHDGVRLKTYELSQPLISFCCVGDKWAGIQETEDSKFNVHYTHP